MISATFSIGQSMVEFGGGNPGYRQEGHRIGQEKNMMVYYRITEGTREEKIDAMLRSRKELAELSVTTSESWKGELADDDLQDLVQRSSAVES